MELLKLESEKTPIEMMYINCEAIFFQKSREKEGHGRPHSPLISCDTRSCFGEIPSLKLTARP